MTFYQAAASWLSFTSRVNELTCNSSRVVMQRNMQFMSGRLTLEESYDMIAEKPAAFGHALRDAAASAIRGAPPLDVACAAMAPLCDKTCENVERLRSPAR